MLERQTGDMNPALLIDACEGASLVDLADHCQAIALATPLMTALVSLQGGQLLQFTPTGHAPMLYRSPNAVYATGKAIRGGIPLCWPWFGAHPDDPSQPAHGVARLSPWTLQGLARIDDMFHVKLAGPDWHGLESSLDIVLGQGIDIRLATVNHSDQPRVVSAALHSYLAINDISTVSVRGVGGSRFDDKTTGESGHYHQDSQTFGNEVDRIVYTGRDLLLIDDSGERRLRIASSGSGSTVIWNPGAARCREIADLPDDGWQDFVCVETANAGSDRVELAPEENHLLTCRLRYEAG